MYKFYTGSCTVQRTNTCTVQVYVRPTCISICQSIVDVQKRRQVYRVISTVCVAYYIKNQCLATSKTFNVHLYQVHVHEIYTNMLPTKPQLAHLVYIYKYNK